MERETAIRRLRAIEPRLRARGMRSLFLFGSTARGDSTRDSDVDLLFEYDPASRFTLLTQADLVEELSAEIGVRVDLIALEGLRSPFRDRAAAEMVRIF